MIERNNTGQPPTTRAESSIFLRAADIRPQKSGVFARTQQNAIIRLSSSIRRYGILEPLLVEKQAGEEGKGPFYLLIDGEKRYHAACIVGMEQIPCFILANDTKSMAKAAIFADLKQKKRHMFEEATAFRELLEVHQLTQEGIARQLGLSQSAVANKLRLLKFSNKEQARILEGRLTERHARTLLRLFDPAERQDALEQVIADRLNVSATEAFVDHLLSKKQVKNNAQSYVFELNQPYLAQKPPQNDGFCLKTPSAWAAGREERAAMAADTPHSKPLHAAKSEAVVQSEVMAPSEVMAQSEVIVQSLPPATLPEEKEPAPLVNKDERAFLEAENPKGLAVSTVSTNAAVREDPAASIPPQGIRPRKFALRDLRPLYNSIEHSLSIFRKTGMRAECTHRESESGVEIVIMIPKHG